MKTYVACLAGLLFLTPWSLSGQPTRTLYWGSSFSPAWANGATNGTAVNVDGSLVDANVNIVRNGGSWETSLFSAGGVMTPSVNGVYNVGTLAPPNNLMMALDYSNRNNNVVVNVTFSSAVYNVSFAISDVDRFLRNRNDFVDEVVVDGNGGAAHPAFTVYAIDPAFPAQLQFAGDTVRPNPNAALSGNSGPAGYPSTFDVAEQAATVNVSFGITPITSLRIRYGSHRTSASNPSDQAIAIGNISFSRIITVPVALSLFEAKPIREQVELQWKAHDQESLEYYAVERSRDGAAFTELARVPVQDRTDGVRYTYRDQSAMGQSGFYRLKMVDNDGSFNYSPVAVVKGQANGFRLQKVYPAVFSDGVTLQAESPGTGEATVCVYKTNGVFVYRSVHPVARGSNNIPVRVPTNLSQGAYLISLEYKGERQVLRAVKQ